MRTSAKLGLLLGLLLGPHVGIAAEETTRQGGETCATAFVISGLPFADSGSTTGYTNDYDEACPYIGSLSPDVVYSYTPAADGAIDVTLCNGDTDYDTKMYIYQDTCPGTVVGCNDDACSSPVYANLVSQLLQMPVMTGHTYYIVIDGYGGAHGTYYLEVTPHQSCVECPPGGLPEPEDCGASTNYGCFGAPAAFTLLQCGETVCGTLWASPSQLDVDWYELTTTQTTTFTWTAKTELLSQITIYKAAGPGDCSSSLMLASHVVQPCDETSTCSGPQPPGTYRFVINPYDWGILLCPQYYWARLDCVVVTGACCIGEVCAATTTVEECAALGGDWFPGYTCDDFVCPHGCWHRVDLYDCFWNGWGGNTLDVYVNGVLLLNGITMPESGSPVSYYFLADTGDTITTVYHPIGEGPDEPFYYLYDGLDYLLGWDGIVGESNCLVQPTGITVAGNCVPPTTGACCYYDGSPCQQTPPDDCVDGLFLGVGNSCFGCPCIAPCPAGGVPEPEECGEDADGGCDSPGRQFAPIACGQTVCGTAWVGIGTYDSDWYQLTTSRTTSFAWTVNAEFPPWLHIIRGAGPNDCSSSALVSSAGGGACQDTSTDSGPQPPGTYWFRVGSWDFVDLPCPQRYVATLTCTEILGACCEPAAPWCELLDPVACTALGGTYLGEFTTCDFAPDCNGNGIPDACDLARCDGSVWCADCNDNDILDSCDIASGASCDCQADGIPDECQLYGEARWILQYDDGTSENSLGLTAGGELCWIHHFAADYPGWIGSVRTCFGTPLYPGSSGVAPGDPFRVFVWNDPNGDGDPSDAVFVGEAAGVVDEASIDSDVLQTVWIYVPTSSSFFIGASVVTTSGYPAPMDENGVQYHQSWVTFNQVPFDPNDVATHLYNMDDIGFTCNWLLRVDANFPPPCHDCDHDGILDVCEIGVEWGGFCDTQGPPCFPLRCDSDCNGNGFPDGCEGDCNGNDRADECDVPPICQGADCSLDCNGDLIPDECQLGWRDCNHNDVPDDCDIAAGTSPDCNSNGKPDECELGYNDCNDNGVPDDCDVAAGTSPDCNSNGKPDECDVAAGTSPDCNSNGVPDECDVASGSSPDCNINNVPDECDVADCDGSLWCRDCQGDGIPDGCQLWTGAERDALLWDDGTSEDAFGLITNAELCWIVHFTAPYPGAVAAVMACFGTPLYPGNAGVSAGQSFRVFVWSDPNGDGDPHDAVLLGEATGVVHGASIDSDVLQTVPIQAEVEDSFFVGASIVTPAGRYPAPMDENGVQHNEAWVAYSTGPFDPHHIHNLFNMAAQNLPCNWLLRAQAFFIAPPNDCNKNDIPDECDIGVEWGGYCTRPPNDPAGPCDSDQNGNGVPDTCEICGDLDSDGNVDLDDYWLFLAAFGACVGQPNYNPTADLDGDGCVTLVDYQAWRMCYLMANGKEFVAPKPQPMPAKRAPQGGADR